MRDYFAVDKLDSSQLSVVSSAVHVGLPGTFSFLISQLKNSVHISLLSSLLFPSLVVKQVSCSRFFGKIFNCLHLF